MKCKEPALKNNRSSSEQNDANHYTILKIPIKNKKDAIIPREENQYVEHYRRM